MDRLHKKLIGSSVILLITFNLYNLLNFVFQFSMARLLSVSEYGVLATLFSLIYLLGVPSESIQTAIAKYSAKQKDKGKLKNVFRRAMKKSFKISVGLFLVFVVFSVFLARFLKTEFPLLILTGMMIFVAFLIPINRGILQGRKQFNQLGINVMSEGLIKIVLGVSFVVVLLRLGLSELGVYGAMFGAIAASFLAFFVSFPSLKEVRNTEEKKSGVVEIYGIIGPAFIISFVIFLLFSMDILIAKMVFSPEFAGIYAVASILGKVVFLGTQPISKAMFPLSSEKKSVKKIDNSLYYSSAKMLLVIIFLTLVVVYFWSDQIVELFSGRVIGGAAEILIYVAIAQGILSFTNLTLFYKLSIDRKGNYLLLFASVLIGALLMFYFSGSLVSFSLALIVSNVLFLIGAILSGRGGN